MDSNDKITLVDRNVANEFKTPPLVCGQSNLYFSFKLYNFTYNPEIVMDCSQAALVKKSKMLYFIKKGIRSTAEHILPVLYMGIYDSCIHKNHSVFIKVHVS